MNEQVKMPTDQFIAKNSIVNWLSGLVFLIISSGIAVITFNGIIPKLLLFIGSTNTDPIYQFSLTALFLIFTVIITLIIYVSKTNKTTVLGLLGIAITGLLIHLLTHKNLQGSALLYVGLPMLLAYIFKTSGSAKSATGGILKGISLIMLLSGPFLQEGFICVIMAAPLFYIIGGIIGLSIDYSRKKSLTKLQASPLLIVIALLSLEGSHPDLSFNREHTVRVEKVVSANVHDVIKQLDQPLKLGNDLPIFLKLFPFPSVKHHTGTQIGEQTTLHFVYYKHVYFSPKIGDLIYQVSARGDNFIESQVIQDDSYVKTYMDWKTSKVSWEALDANRTNVIWEISYHRKLDPAWYFGTLEYFTTSLMAEALIKYAATPERARNK